MKILILSNEYPPLGGGTANEVFFTLREFENFSNLQVDLITASNDKFKQEIFTKNSKIYFLNIGKKNNNLHFQSAINLIIYSINTLLFAHKLISDEKYDFVFCYSGIPAGYIGFLLKIFHKVPYIIRLQGTDVPFHEQKWYLLDKLFFSWLSPMIWKHAVDVHANSEKLKISAQQISPNQPVGVIYNGVDTNFFKPCFPKNEIRLSPPIIILSVGRLAKIKNFTAILQAVAKIKYKIKVEIQLVGDGPEKNNLHNLAQQLGVNIKLFGMKTKQELVFIYQNADIYVLPSKNEGMSNTVLEAMACGLPCIVSDVGGSHELVENENNGFILAKNNEKHLQEKLEFFVKNPTEMIRMGKNSRQKAEQKSWQQVAKQLVEIMNKG